MMVAIISGLNTPPIRRLKRTWEPVNAKFMAALSSCEATIDTSKNFANYRSTLASISHPAVYFIGALIPYNGVAERMLTRLLQRPLQMTKMKRK